MQKEYSDYFVGELYIHAFDEYATSQEIQFLQRSDEIRSMAVWAISQHILYKYYKI